MIKFPKDQVDNLIGQKIYCARVFCKETEDGEIQLNKVKVCSDIVKNVVHNGDDKWYALTIIFNNIKDLNLQFKSYDNDYELDCHEVMEPEDIEDYNEFHFLSEANCLSFVEQIKQDIKEKRYFDYGVEYYYYDKKIEEIFIYNSDLFVPPTNCPVCGSELFKEGEYLICRNEDCPAQTSGSIRRWINKLNIIDFGDTLIEAIVESGLAETIDQLYDLKPEQVFSLYYNGRRVGENGIKAIKSLNSKKELTLDMFIGSLGIPLWGRSMVKTIMNAGFNTLEKLTMAHVDELINIQGVGPERAKTFVEGIKNKKDLIDKILSKGIIIKSNEGYLTGKSFCFTGFRNNNFETLIEQKGGTMKSGVSKDLTYLVTNDPSSATGKAAKARGYGINIIGIEELENLLNN